MEKKFMIFQKNFTLTSLNLLENPSKILEICDSFCLCIRSLNYTCLGMVDTVYRISGGMACVRVKAELVNLMIVSFSHSKVMSSFRMVTVYSERWNFSYEMVMCYSERVTCYHVRWRSIWNKWNSIMHDEIVLL